LRLRPAGLTVRATWRTRVRAAIEAAQRKALRGYGAGAERPHP
jgi:hypothetical protein